MPEMTSYRHGVPAWVDVSAPDVDAVVAEVAGLGGTVVVPPMDIPNDSGRTALALDTPTNGTTYFAIGQFIAMDDSNDWPA